MGKKSIAESRETYVELTNERTRIVQEDVADSGFEIFQAGPMRIGLRNKSGAKRKFVLSWRGVGHDEFTLDPFSQIIVDAKLEGDSNMASAKLIGESLG